MNTTAENPQPHLAFKIDAVSIVNLNPLFYFLHTYNVIDVYALRSSANISALNPYKRNVSSLMSDESMYVQKNSALNIVRIKAPLCWSNKIRRTKR